MYDATDYLQDHPGGADSILLMAGEDATEDFMAIHSADAKRKLSEVSFKSSPHLIVICSKFSMQVSHWHSGW